MDFISGGTHQVTILMSDRGLPKSYRTMHGFGSHTFSFINANNERFWIKFHMKSQQGIENLSDEEAALLVGSDRESHQRDLMNAIDEGNFPKRKMFVQVMPEADAKTYHIHPFDLTKVWPKGDYPLIPVGEFELNRNPENYFAQIEQLAFNQRVSFPLLDFHQTKCCKVDCFRTVTHNVIDWA